MRCATYLRSAADVVDEDFISRGRFAIFVGSDRGITLTVFTRAAAIAALLLAAACGGEPEVLEPDPSRATATPSAAPSVPAQSSEDTDEGAASFAYHWVELFNYASISGDTKSLEEFSSGCRACLDYAETIAALGPNERPTAAPWEVTATRVNRDSRASNVRFSLRIPDGSVEDIAFEMTAKPPFEIRRLYSVEDE